MVRLSVFVLLAAVLPAAGLPALLGAAAAVVVVLLLHPLPFLIWWRAVRRLRWLLLAIAAVALWLTPGEPLWQHAPALVPSREGLGLAVHHILSLLLLCTTALWLFTVTPQAQMIAALVRCSRPLLGRARAERLAVRLLLTLEAVPVVLDLVQDVRKQQPAQTSPGLLVAWSRLAGDVLAGVERWGQHATSPLLHIAVLPPIPARDWCWLLAPAILLYWGQA